MSKLSLSGVRVFICAFLLVPFSFSSNLNAQTNSAASYSELLTSIREVRNASEFRIEAAVEQEKVREAWETGKLIDEHILLHKERAEYDKEVLVRLAKDLGTSKTELYYMLGFFRSYPIFPAPGKLSWAHYRELIVIDDAQQRDKIENEAARGNWSQKELRRQIKKRKLSHPSSSNALVGDLKLPESKPGKPGVYRVAESKGKKYYDLGFSTFLEIKNSSMSEGTPYKEGDAVRCEMPDAGSKKKQKTEWVSCILNPESTLSDFYTYPAEVTQIVDGDTFHARIDLGFGIVMNKRLRLLRVDASEIETREGKEAKAYLEKLLTRSENQILIKTFGEDQHGRPLCEVWVDGKSVEQAMLDKGLAVLIQE